MKITAETKRTGKLDAIIEKLAVSCEDARRFELAVGYPVNDSRLGAPNPAYDNRASIMEVALKNNYGIGVPRRPFLDMAVTAMTQTYKTVLAKNAKALSNGEAKLQKVLDLAGLQAEEDVRRSIMEGNWEPNAPATIAHKKSDRPLVDTATMMNRVTHKVRERT